MPRSAPWRALLLLVAACIAPPPAAPDGAPLAPRVVPPLRLRPPLVDVIDYDIAVDIDPAAGMVDGSLTVTFAALPDRPAARLQLDAVELQIRGAWDEDGNALATDVHDDVLDIALPQPLAPGAQARVTVEWRAWPTRGLYFVRPSAAEPQRPWQFWTQGETHETRHWLPVWDQPDDRVTHTLAVTLDERFITMAAGTRISSRSDALTRRRTDTWRLDVPHPAYLITLVAGELAQSELDGLPLPVVADPAALEAATQSLQPTADMLALLAEWSGRPYPYPKYAQSFVREFVAGGQENISATTLTHDVIHAAQDEPQLATGPTGMQSLIVHEAAHQWFGDLITCRDWSHLWLNEGFATYAELLWARRSQGEDAARAVALGWQRQMVDFQSALSRPIVWSGYDDPDELFETPCYEGAATRLLLLAELLGAEAFDRGVQLYVARHAVGDVVTSDLRAALEEASGADLGGFFEEWIEGVGFPRFEVRVAAGAPPVLVARQVQGPESGRAVFHLPLQVAWSTGGVEHVARLDIDEVREELPLPGDGPLDWVRFDASTVVPGLIELLQPEAAWCAQLAGARDGVTRLVAAQWFALDPHVVAGNLGELELQPESLLALEAAACGDAFANVRTVALQALCARTPAGDANLVHTLVELARDPDPRVRAVAADGLAIRDGEDALTTLLGLARDPNGEVAAAALDALVARGLPAAFTLGRQLYVQADPLRWRLRRDVLGALAGLPDDARVAPLLVAALRSDPSAAVRAEALRLLVTRDDPPRDVVFRLTCEALWDASRVVRAAAARSLTEWPASLAEPQLRARLAVEPDGAVLGTLHAALAALP
jgi:aminopeptidase N